MGNTMVSNKNRKRTRNYAVIGSDRREEKIRAIVISSFLVEKIELPDGKIIYRKIDNNCNGENPVGIIITGAGRRGLVVDMSDTAHVKIYNVRFVKCCEEKNIYYRIDSEAHFTEFGEGRRAIYKNMRLWNGRKWETLMLRVTSAEMLALSYLAYRIRVENINPSEETTQQYKDIQKWSEHIAMTIVYKNKDGISSSAVKNISDVYLWDLGNVYLGVRNSEKILARFGTSPEPKDTEEEQREAV